MSTRPLHPDFKKALDGLNNQQKDVVFAPLDGNLAVLAGAGTGKTTVLTLRIAWLIHNGVSPEDILALTFTKSAALEMKERLKKLIGFNGVRVRLTTFHALGFKLLSTYGEYLGLKKIHCIDEEDGEALVRRHLKKLPGWKTSKELSPKSRLNEVLVYKQRKYWIERKEFEANPLFRKEALTNFKPLLPDQDEISPFNVADSYKAYELEKLNSNFVDFSDLALLPLKLLQEFPECRQKIQSGLRYLLVDEFQDTDLEQIQLLKYLTEYYTTASTMVVGDDDQSLYSWRGAIPGVFPQYIKEAKALELRLEENYRCQPTIIDCANKVIENNQDRMGKTLKANRGIAEKLEIRKYQNDREEASKLCLQIKTWLNSGFEPKDIALLYRKNKFSTELERALLREKIPYRVYGGLDFFKREEIKDVMAYMKLIVNPNDNQSFIRVVNKPRRGIGDKALMEHSGLADDWGVNYISACPGSKNKHMQNFCAIVESLKDIKDKTPLEAVNTILDKTGLQEWYRTGQNPIEKGEKQAENLELLKDWAANFGDLSSEYPELSQLESFLLVSNLESEAMSKSDNAVNLRTIHGAKGLEFPIVVLVAMEEGQFPADRGDPEEERRLFYVGLTRGKDKVLLTYAENRMHFGTMEKSWPSPFLKELPKHQVVYQS